MSVIHINFATKQKCQPALTGLGDWHDILHRGHEGFAHLSITSKGAQAILDFAVSCLEAYTGAGGPPSLSLFDWTVKVLSSAAPIPDPIDEPDLFIWPIDGFCDEWLAAGRRGEAAVRLAATLSGQIVSKLHAHYNPTHFAQMLELGPNCIAQIVYVECVAAQIAFDAYLGHDFYFKTRADAQAFQRSGGFDDIRQFEKAARHNRDLLAYLNLWPAPPPRRTMGHIWTASYAYYRILLQPAHPQLRIVRSSRRGVGKYALEVG